MTDPGWIVKDAETRSVLAYFYDHNMALMAAAMQNHAYQTDAYRVEEWIEHAS